MKSGAVRQASTAGDGVLGAAKCEANALESGVTTVRDLGSFEQMDLAMRDLIRRWIGSACFQVEAFLVFATDEFVKPGQPVAPGTADGPADVMQVVRLQIAAG